MAPRPPAPGIIRIELLHEMAAQPAVNVLHGAFAGGVLDMGTLQDTCTSILTSWETRMVPAISSACLFRGVRCTDLTSETGPQVLAEADLPGEDERPCTDAARAMCVTMRTAMRNRSGRGRVYVAGLADAKVGNSRFWLSATVEDVVVRMSQFRAEIGTEVLGPIGVELGVLSYFTGGALRAAPLFTNMTSFDADARLDHQRRRVGKR